MDSIIFEDPSVLRTRSNRRRPAAVTSVQRPIPDNEQRCVPYPEKLSPSRDGSARHDTEPARGDLGLAESETVYRRRRESTELSTSPDALQDGVLHVRENEIGSLAGSWEMVSLHHNFTVNQDAELPTAEDLQNDLDSLFSSPALGLASVAVADIQYDTPLTSTIDGPAGPRKGDDEGPTEPPQIDLLAIDLQGNSIPSTVSSEHPAPFPHHSHFSLPNQETAPGNIDNNPVDGKKVDATLDGIEEVDFSDQWQSPQRPDQVSDRVLTAEYGSSWKIMSDAGSAADHRQRQEGSVCDDGRRCPTGRPSRHNGGNCELSRHCAVTVSPEFGLLDGKNAEKYTESGAEHLDCLQCGHELRAPGGVAQKLPTKSPSRRLQPEVVIPRICSPRQTEQLSPAIRKRDEPLSPAAYRRSPTTLQGVSQESNLCRSRKRNLTGEDSQVRVCSRRRRFEGRPEPLTHLHDRSTVDKSAAVNGVRFGTDLDKHIDIGNGIKYDAAARGCITKAATSNSDEDLRYNNPSSLMGISVQPVTPADVAFFTALVEDPAEVKTLLESPTAWGLSCGVSPTRLTNVTVKPLTTNFWLVTATIARSHDFLHDRGRRVTGRTGSSLEGTDSDSAYHPSGDEGESRGTKRGQWTAEEDDDLRRWKRLGKSWSWIFNRFPERTEAAVRSRWFVVLAPRETSARTARV